MQESERLPNDQVNHQLGLQRSRPNFGPLSLWRGKYVSRWTTQRLKSVVRPDNRGGSRTMQKGEAVASPLFGAVQKSQANRNALLQARRLINCTAGGRAPDSKATDNLLGG
jgi:hypothetical protein